MLISFRWAPAEEQSKFVTFTYIGNIFGTMVAYPISGLILDTIAWRPDGESDNYNNAK